MNRSHQSWQPFPLGLIVFGLIWPLGFAAAMLMEKYWPIDYKLADNPLVKFLWLVLWPLGILFVVAGLIQMKSLQRLPPDRRVSPMFGVTCLWLISFAVSVAVVWECIKK